MSTTRFSHWNGTDPRDTTGMQAAVLGSPVGHSLSPVLHRAAYAALGLDWSYTTVDCDEAGLRPFLDALDESWAGLSLTMPLKRQALALVDEVSDLALDTGGANTIVCRDGRLFGDNTDVHGIVTALREAGIDKVVEPDRAVVLGGGATACSALAALRELGLGEVVVVVRERSRAAEVCAAAIRLGVDVGFRTFDEISDALRGTSLVLSTLPAQAADPHAAAIAQSGAAVFDVVYANWPTRIARAASFNGSPVMPGLSMLLHQAVRQVELMTGRTEAPLEEMRRAVHDEVERRQG